jgi:hypothetical protein
MGGTGHPGDNTSRFGLLGARRRLFGPCRPLSRTATVYRVHAEISGYHQSAHRRYPREKLQSQSGHARRNDPDRSIGRRSGELNVSALGKGDDYCVVRADHIEPRAAAR